jgi:hypothetical protein
MHIPVVGYESFAAFYNPGTPVYDEDGNVVGVRGLIADIRWELSMPSLGADDLELIAHATINQDRDGLALLRMWATGEILAGGEVVGHMTAVNLPIQLEGSLYVSLITATGVFFEGPLKGCTFSWTSRFIGGQAANPPTYLAEIKGFLVVPTHVEIGELAE